MEKHGGSSVMKEVVAELYKMQAIALSPRWPLASPSARGGFVVHVLNRVLFRGGALLAGGNSALGVTSRNTCVACLAARRWGLPRRLSPCGKSRGLCLC